MKMLKVLTTLCWVLMGSMYLIGPNLAAEEKERCFKPKFRSFNPPNHAEIAPGSEISFHVKNVDKTKVKATVKDIPISLALEDHNLFYIARGKLPDSLVDTYARISLSGVAELGCKAKDGWLVKITGAEQATQEIEADEVQTETEEKSE